MTTRVWEFRRNKEGLTTSSKNKVIEVVGENIRYNKVLEEVWE